MGDYLAIGDRARRLVGGELDKPYEPPTVQDTVALARIDADAPVVPYPLMHEDRSEAGAWELLKYLGRLVWWRIRSRGWKK